MIYCCTCEKYVYARLTSGKEIYPSREDLYSLPFWICDTCKNYVGCHHKTINRTKPLGCIPSKELKSARSHIHKILDPLWQGKKSKRGKIYNIISNSLGYEYHTAELRTIEEARKVYKIVQQLAQGGE